VWDLERIGESLSKEDAEDGPAELLVSVRTQISRTACCLRAVRPSGLVLSSG
jgi:hypothetical protein